MEPLPLACLSAVSDSWFWERATEASGISYIIWWRILQKIDSSIFVLSSNINFSSNPTFIIVDYEGLDVAHWLPGAVSVIKASPFYLCYLNQIQISNSPLPSRRFSPVQSSWPRGALQQRCCPAFLMDK